ncbi:MAG: hypothetical protein CFH22_00484 [Alphaproteobacteria bacterium MarineAlpha5_Bin12]|nr:MAG: hypothetical protein CFH22_00484 [Alphaproteobacteria bacterium MarineAlpha5_Bin12]|tara:strand:- start:980 stop:1327 length:348 start_codon:yes stop_codon:yes gene_type:complete
MKNLKDNIDHLNVLRKIQNNPDASQREMAKDLGFSLGKLNYCLSALKAKGLVKVNNFRQNKNKINYIYILTPKGILQKTNLTIKFMQLKMNEYDELNRELLEEKNKLIDKKKDQK